MSGTIVERCPARRARARALPSIAAALMAAFVTMLAATSPATAQEAALRIAVLDIDFVAVQSPSGQALASEIEGLRQQYGQELAMRQAEVNAIQARIAEVPDDDIETQRTLQRQYQDALTGFQRFQQDVQAQAQQRQAEGLAKVREEIGPVIEAIMEEEGFDLILNAANPVVIMSSERVDITQTVLERLQAGGDG